MHLLKVIVTCGDNSSWCLITLITHHGELKALTSCSGAKDGLELVHAGHVFEKYWIGAFSIQTFDPDQVGAVMLHWGPCSVWWAEGLGESKETIMRMESLNVNIESGASIIWIKFSFIFCSHQISLQLFSKCLTGGILFIENFTFIIIGNFVSQPIFKILQYNTQSYK